MLQSSGLAANRAKTIGSDVRQRSAFIASAYWFSRLCLSPFGLLSRDMHFDVVAVLANLRVYQHRKKPEGLICITKRSQQHASQL